MFLYINLPQPHADQISHIIHFQQNTLTTFKKQLDFICFELLFKLI
jgi:hypothetical protein